MKKSLCTTFVIVPILILFCFAQCKKEYTPLTITLYDKPLGTIQSYIQGKWRLHYMFGGICGSCKYDREIYNEYYEFLPNRRITYTYQNSMLADTTYKWITYQANSLDYVHNIIEYYDKGLVPYHFEVDKIINDTLVLAQPFLNNPDYMLYFLTKSK